MSWKSLVYIAALASLVLGTLYATYSGAMLRGPEKGGSLSLRNVQTRRTHFMRYHSFGK
jgi:hypothetical protein